LFNSIFENTRADKPISDRREISGFLDGGEQLGELSRISFWSDVNILELIVVMVAQVYIYEKPLHSTLKMSELDGM
jgi:hypothetical protein